MVWEFLIINFFMPLASLSKSYRFYSLYRHLLKEQWLPSDKIENIQNKRLVKIVEHAYSTVPIYKKLCDEVGVGPDDLVDDIENIKRFPIITKEIIRNNFPDGVVSSESCEKNYIYNSTSGSTGTPFQFIMDKNLENSKKARAFLFLDWAGVKPGIKHIKLWGGHEESVIKRLATKYLLRRTEISCFDMDERKEDYFALVRKLKPKALEAYTSAAVKLAKLADDSNANIHFDSIITSAENLYEKDRAYMEKIFDGKVYNRYGSREFGNLVQECPEEHNLHVVNSHFFVEIVKEDGEWAKPGEQGRLIVTNFDNRIMPMIRYDTGDMATATDNVCTCGRGFPIIESIDGRVSDFIKLEDGTLIPYLYFNYFFEQYGKFVRDFQVEQLDFHNIVLRIVKTGDLDDRVEKRIVDGLKEKLGVDVMIEINYLDKIPLTKAGKKRVVIRMK